MNNLSNQYVAGFLDGEGWFRIKKTKGYKSPSYQILVGASSTDEEILKLLVKKYGGSIYKRFKKDNWKAEYSYQIMCKQAEQLIEKILPYLIIKKERAFICLELSKSKKLENGVKLTQETIDYRENLFMDMKILNQRGVLNA